MPPCSRPSKTLRAADAVAAKSGSSLTAAARDGRHRVQVGTEGWSQSNKRIGRSTLATKHSLSLHANASAVSFRSLQGQELGTQSFVCRSKKRARKIQIESVANITQRFHNQRR